MPTPRPSEETEREWMQRCVPVVLEDGTAETQDQAVAVCSSMWADATKAARGTHMNSTRLRFRLDLKALDEREFEGHAAVFGNVDLSGDVVIEGAFQRSLARHRRDSTMPPMFWMHNPGAVPGVWKEIHEDEKGLHVIGELVETQLGDEMRTLLQKKAVRGLSIGFRTVDVDFDKEGNRLLKEIDLWEVSLVSLAMNPKAKVTAVKARLSSDGEYVPTEREFEEDLHRMGYSKSVARGLVAALRGTADGGTPLDSRWDAGDAVDEEVLEILQELETVQSKVLRDVFQNVIH